MSKEAFKDFKRFWLNTYIKQYKEGNKQIRRAIKENIYKQIKLTEEEKDKIWEEVVNRGGIL